MAPMASASTPPLTCPFITSANFAAWNAQVIGQIGDAGAAPNGLNGWGKTVYWAGPAFPAGGVGGFLSIENNLVRNLNDQSPLASFKLESIVAVEPGLDYFIEFSVLGDYANKSNDPDRRYQKVEFLINDVVVWADATEAVDGLPGQLTKAHGPVNVSTALMTVPAGATSVKIAYRFTLPAKPTNAQRSSIDDIIVSVPRFVCPNIT